MRKRMIVAVVVLAIGGLQGLATPAQASCNEVGDPACTVGAWASAGLCTAQEVAKSGGKPNTSEIADCFTQPTGNQSADTGLKDDVECLFRVYIQEGGESGLDCLT